MSWEIGLAKISNLAPVSSFRACGRWHGSAPKTSLQLLDNELSTTYFYPPVAEVSFNDTTRPRSENAGLPSTRPNEPSKEPRQKCRSDYRILPGETCMLSFRFSLRRETNQRIPTLISFRTKWYFSNSYQPDDRRTPPEENLSDFLGFQTRIRLRLCELLDRAPRRVLASAHYVQMNQEFLDSGSVPFEFQFIYTITTNHENWPVWHLYAAIGPPVPASYVSTFNLFLCVHLYLWPFLVSFREIYIHLNHRYILNRVGFTDQSQIVNPTSY